MPKRIDLQGRRFSYLTVTEFVGMNKNGHALWECRCDCGNTKIVPSHKLLDGEYKSCGCMHHKYGHGKTETRLYHIWRTMKARCLNVNSQKYKNYGGRGITICDEWKNNFQAFYDWATSHGYTEEMSIDRVDVDMGYRPSNCQWITTSENSRKAWRDRKKHRAVMI